MSSLPESRGRHVVFIAAFQNCGGSLISLLVIMVLMSIIALAVFLELKGSVALCQLFLHMTDRYYSCDVKYNLYPLKLIYSLGT